MTSIAKYMELIFWCVALLWLYFIKIETTHFTLCPLSNLGLDFCPGCGLGKSISLIFSGDFVQSLHAHPLGVLALIIILHRIIVLFRNNFIREEFYNESSINTTFSGR